MWRAISDAQSDLRQFCALPGLGELSPQAVLSHAPDEKLLLDGAGRCSLWWRRTPAYPGHRLGLIGHYAADNAQTAAQVLTHACERLRDAGCTLAVGPMDGSTWRRYRLLTQRGSESVFFLEPDNPDDWPGHWESAGFTPLAHYFSAVVNDLNMPDDSLAARLSGEGYRIHSVDPARIPAALEAIWTVAVDAFAQNFLYTPLAKEEFLAGYTQLLPHVRPELVLTAEHGGRPAGFCFAIPNLLQGARGEPIDTIVVKTLAVSADHARRGLGKLLYRRTLNAAAALGYRRALLALMHEDNPSRRIGGPGARDIRQYILYARPL